MHVAIIGAAGMVGRKTIEAIGAGAWPQVSRLTLVDMVEPEAPDGIPATCIAADVSGPGVAERVLEDRPDVLLHLAAVVSGTAEAEFDLGYRINMDGTRALLEAARAAGNVPRVVFTSSIAVYGAPFPDRIGDDEIRRPLTSYGTQKAIGELLVDDYSRKGFVDGVSIRLPTLVVRPGAPNGAASSFFSGIIREPLAGEEAVLPVPEETRHYLASPRSAAGFVIHAATMDTGPLGTHRAMTMPGLCASVAEEIAALERAGGDAGLIRRETDEAVERIVAGWPQDFTAERARALGFTSEGSMDEIVRVYVEDHG